MVPATLQSAKGEFVFAEEEATEEEIMAEDENENGVGGGNDTLPDNMDDVLEAEDICSRYSPKEVFHSVIHPCLFKILDEMSAFVEAVLYHLEAAVHTLLPHVDQSPIGKLRVEELFLETRTFMFGTMSAVYSEVRQAWRELIIAYIHNPSSSHHTLAALTHVMGVHVIQTSLHIPNNTNDHDVALVISRELPKIAPNFLGIVIYKLLKRGSNPEAFEEALTDPLRSIIPLVEKIHTELEATINRIRSIGEGKKKEEADAEDDEEEAMEAFWRAALEASHLHLKKWPLLEENFQLIYSNEEYLSEVLLQLISTL
ncbi:hypothetical protein GWK47_005986 [Chionoecetes opilio]|uniref:Uncharacterized protein n=1 Tax=Chionoecetes opilio TaxID=41210 RepID=A0A8J4YJ65_CHIOP|nr:hypothetical protein GWK47_005986 [Chionoecetes opilio]